MTDYSKAFERLVRTDSDGEDVVGLLAYAYYKRDKRDLAMTGETTSDALREHYKTLTPGLIDQYRENAIRRLESYAQKVVATVEPEIRESTRIDAISVATTEIIAEVRKGSRPWLSIVWNVVAWLITLAITFLVATSFGKVSLNISPN